MYVVDAHGVPLGILDLESQLEWIKKDSQQIKGNLQCVSEKGCGLKT